MSRGVFRQWPYGSARPVGAAALMPASAPADVPPTRGLVGVDEWRRRQDIYIYEPPAPTMAPVLDAFRRADNAFIAAPPLRFPTFRPYFASSPYDPPQPMAAVLAGAPTQGNGDLPPAPLSIARYPYWPAYANQQAGEEFIAATVPQNQGAGDAIPPTPIPYPERERTFDWRVPPPNALASVLAPGVLIFGARYTFDYDPIYPTRRWRLIYRHGTVAAYSSVRPDSAPVLPDNPPPQTLIPSAAYLRRNDGRLPVIAAGNLTYIPLLQGAADVIAPTIVCIPARVPDRYPQQPQFLTAVIPQPQGSGDSPPPLPPPPVVLREPMRPLGKWNPGVGWLAAVDDTDIVVGPDSVQAVGIFERPRYPRVEPIKAGIAIFIVQPQGSADVPPGQPTVIRYDRRVEARALVPPPFFTQGTPPIPADPPGPLVIARYATPPDVRTRYTATYVLQPAVILPDAPPAPPPIASTPPFTDARTRFVAPLPTVAWLAPQSIGYVAAPRLQMATPLWRAMPQTFVRLAAFFNDITPPTVPVQGAPTVIGDNAIDVNWTASTDAGSGVAGYYIYINGARVTPFPVSGILYHALALAAGTTYAFQVSALDNAGNESARSAVQFATTTGASAGGLVFTRRRFKRRG